MGDDREEKYLSEMVSAVVAHGEQYSTVVWVMVRFAALHAPYGDFPPDGTKKVTEPHPKIS